MSTPADAVGAPDARFAAALLDVDGTLLLSNDAHARAWHDAFGESGYEVPTEALRRLIGMGGDKLLRAIDPNLREDRPPGAEIARRRAEIFKQRYLETVHAGTRSTGTPSIAASASH